MLMNVITGPILYIRAGFNSINWMNTLTNTTNITTEQKTFKNLFNWKENPV